MEYSFIISLVFLFSYSYYCSSNTWAIFFCLFKCIYSCCLIIATFYYSWIYCIYCYRKFHLLIRYGIVCSVSFDIHYKCVFSIRHYFRWKVSSVPFPVWFCLVKIWSSESSDEIVLSSKIIVFFISVDRIVIIFVSIYFYSYIFGVS